MVKHRVMTSACAAGIWCVSVAACWAQNLRSGVPEGNIEVLLDVVVSQTLDPATEFSFIDLVPFPDATGRLAVSTVQGGVRVIDAAGNLSPTHLLTKAQTELVLPQEAGLTGIAFHPDFNHTSTFGYGKLYTITTERRASQGGFPDSAVDFPFASEEHQDVVREWNLAAFGNVPGNAANNAFTGNLANSRELLRVDQPGPFHNVVDLAFNTHAEPLDADYGMLYITSGDGGNNSVQSHQDRAEGAQMLSTIYGKVLRIDPDPTAHPLVRLSAHTGQPAYSIPADNPYNGDDMTETKTSSTLAEIWAHGLRSPWRMNFDRATGMMYIGDVGENAREEANLIEKGKNYGWGLMEGSLDGPHIPGDGTTTPGLTLPLIELPAGTASDSITGGFVYRGSAIPELVGKYVFADLGQGYEAVGAAIFYGIVDPDDPDGDVGDVFEFRISPLSPKFEDNTQVVPERIFSIGEDLDGEIYLIAGPDPRQAFNPNRPSLVIRLADAPLFGDLTFDELIDPADWSAFKLGQGASFASLARIEAYAKGDLDGDLDHDLADFQLFRTAYIDANGEAAFAALLDGVPEPTAAVLALVALCGFSATRRRFAHRQIREV